MKKCIVDTENLAPIDICQINEVRRNFSSVCPSQRRNRDSKENCCQIRTHEKMDGRVSHQV